MHLTGHIKAFAKRHWPSLSIRTILFGTLLFVAALPGVGAVFLRVYENTLVQQTEAELIAQGAVLAAAYRAQWGGSRDRVRPLAPEPPQIDLRVDPVLPGLPPAVRAGRADPRAVRVGMRLAAVATDAAAVTLAATRLLDRNGIVVLGREDLNLSHAALPEVARALRGQPTTVLRTRIDNPYGFRSPLEMLSRAVSIRVHHVRPVIAQGRVVGAVMLSRSPRGLFLGIYQDRGKIALGVAAIFVTLVGLAGLLSRGIARPIRDLSAASAQVARGVVSIPEPPVTAAIEIRDLYANFGAMAERIEIRARYLRDFAAAVSHEFKTPLTGIRGALELLADHGGEMDEAERRRFLGNATADANRLAMLVQRLLDLARADMASATVEPACDVAAVARAVAVQTVAPVVSVFVEGPIPPVRVAPDALAAVLQTLIDNSRRAGATTVAIGIGPGVVVRVADDGRGIDPADRARIFEPFFTGDRAGGGTGLGLPIAMSLLAATGGIITLAKHGAESESGATFVLSLPVGSGGYVPPDPSTSAGPPPVAT